MINDLALRWVVTALFLFSAGVCVQAIVRNRHSTQNLVSHSLHAIMAIAMAVMAWPRGAELPPRAPMIFFAAAAVWFAVVMLRDAGHRVGNAYHALMMLAMAWMYAAMGGLPLASKAAPESGAMPEMDMPGMPGMTGHAGHGGHGSGMASAVEPATWVEALNWVCAVGFTAAAVFWLYRLVVARVQPTKGDSAVGILCQFAMAAGMAIMFGVML